MLGLPDEMPWGVVTYHPATLEKDMAGMQIKTILAALDRFPQICWIFTLPNADMESRVIIKSIEEYVKKNPGRTFLFSSLGQLRYLSLMRNSIVMVGNSSSGIIEAPSFKLPVVNIGSRQKGRIMAKNIINVTSCEENKIVHAIDKAISEKFRGLLKVLENPYGGGNVSKRVINVLKKVSLTDKFRKHFYDL